MRVYILKRNGNAEALEFIVFNILCTMKWFHYAAGPETYYLRYLHFTDVVFIYIQEKNHLGSLYKLEEKDVKFNQPSKNWQFQFLHAITYLIKYRLIDSAAITKLTNKVE